MGRKPGKIFLKKKIAAVSKLKARGNETIARSFDFEKDKDFS